MNKEYWEIMDTNRKQVEDWVDFELNMPMPTEEEFIEWASHMDEAYAKGEVA